MRRETGARCVSRVRALAGGRSSAVHLVVVESATGTRERVVLRRYVLDWVAEEPEAPGNEALVLGLLAGTAVPAPRLVAADPDGSVTGTPAVLMSALPGRVDWRHTDLGGWLRRLVEAMLVVHDVAPDPRLQTFAPWAPTEGLVPPPWTRHRRAWEKAVQLYRAGVPSTERVLVHRDYHPGNVLWARRRVSGIVDWVNTCSGPPEADVAQCRQDLAEDLGPDVAEEFLRIWLSMTGRRTYDPYFDLTNAVSTVGPTPDPATDAFVARAAALT